MLKSFFSFFGPMLSKVVLIVSYGLPLAISIFVLEDVVNFFEAVNLRCS